MPAELVYYMALVPAILAGITFHEFAHARVALAFGDTTAQDEGRVTLNPLAHLDPLGTLLIVLAGFGWGRPTPVNPLRFRHPKADTWVSLAGPASNLALAVACGAIFRLYAHTQPALGVFDSAVLFCRMFVDINLMLCLFNLIPIYPLDGSHVLEQLLPYPTNQRVAIWNRQYGWILLLGLIALGYFTTVSVFDVIIGLPVAALRLLILGF